MTLAQPHIIFSNNPRTLYGIVRYCNRVVKQKISSHMEYAIVTSSYQKVIYKEGRDIVEENDISYADAVKNLEQARLAFRELNRKLRLSSFETLVDFQDE